jgi:hypothetical protein
MKLFKINPDMLSGKYRQDHSKIYFDTMDTIVDGVEYFRKALGTELEHGQINPITNVTEDDEVSTAQIVVAHLSGVEADKPQSTWKFFPGYYDALWWMETAVPNFL